MKSYNQLKEDVESLYLKEWERSDEEFKKGWIEVYSKVYDIELDEEHLSEIAPAIPLGYGAMAAFPWVKAAALTGGAYLASKVPEYLQKRKAKIDQENWLKGNKLKKGETQTSGNTTTGVNKSYTPSGNNKNNKNNGGGKFPWKTTLGVAGAGTAVNQLSTDKDKNIEKNYTNNNSSNNSKSPPKFINGKPNTSDYNVYKNNKKIN